MRRDRSNVAGPRAKALWIHRLATFAGALGLLQAVTGCTLEDQKPDLALDTPDAYRAAHGTADAALPSLDWWRGFRSRELTSLIQNAEGGNFDIAVAIAQIEQADAQARIAGAPLLPSIDLNASATLSKPSTSGGGGGGGA